MDSCNGCTISYKDFLAMDEEEVFAFLQRHGVVLKSKDCPNCSKPATLSFNAKRPISTPFWRCRRMISNHQQKRKLRKVQCSFKESAIKRTFFSKSHVGIEQACNFVAWEMKGSTISFLREELGWSQQTVVDWSNFLREIYLSWTKKNAKQIIGGDGLTVEIDETKIGRRKYNCGRVVDGQWVFGGICRETGDFFLVPVEDRSQETLLPIIEANIANGTRIISDCWKSYNGLKDANYSHMTVNHSVNFVNPETGANTQRIERLWRDLKENIPHYGRKTEHYQGYLARFTFLKRHPNHTSRFHAIFSAMGELFNPERDESTDTDNEKE
ncbi:uncharacterized protein [Drosophila takahashii]|uniref:uncharacterized protein n=1 Tax=Drosophila takahashii TaxID=29030 RepID=UPI0038994E0A